MGLISRLKRISPDKIEAYIASVSSPERILPVLLDELANKVTQAAKAEAKALTAVRSAHRKLDESSGRAARMTRGAQMALQAGDTDLARRAIAAQIETESEIEIRDHALDTSESAYQNARSVRMNLQTIAKDLRLRREELISRARNAKSTEKVQEINNDALANSRSILDEVARMEDRVRQDEAQTDLGNEITRTLGPEFSEMQNHELQSSDEITSRLQQLSEDINKEN